MTTEHLADRLEELSADFRSAVQSGKTDKAYEARAFLEATLVNNLPAIISALRGRGSVIEECARIAEAMARKCFKDAQDPDMSYHASDREAAKSDAADAITEAIRSLSSTSQVIAGMVLVPEEPTLEMMDAGYDATRRADGYPEFADAGFVLGHARTIYRAMIKAAEGGGE